MGPTEIALLFIGLVAVAFGAALEIVRPPKRVTPAPGRPGTLLLVLWAVRPWWCYLLGLGLIVAAVVMAAT